MSFPTVAQFAEEQIIRKHAIWIDSSLLQEQDISAA